MRMRTKRPILRAQIAAMNPGAFAQRGRYEKICSVGEFAQCWWRYCLPMPTPSDPNAEHCVMIPQNAASGLGLASATPPTQRVAPQLQYGRRYR